MPPKLRNKPSASPEDRDRSPGKKKATKSKPKSVKTTARRSVTSSRAKKIIEICGGYDPIKKLGQGAYGATWEAKKGRKTFAVKISAPEEIAPGAPSYKTDIIKEIDLFTRLKHPNVIDSVNQLYVSGSQVCYFMPQMEFNFQKIIDEKLDEYPYSDQKWQYTSFKKMLCGVAYLHANFVIHCDLKPENIMYDSKSDSVRLIDYGLAVIFGSTGKVKFDTPVITAPWRPPEMFAMEVASYPGGKDLISAPSKYYYGPEVDIYSMGWIGMELLYRIQPPYLGGVKIQSAQLMMECLIAMGCSMGPDFSVKYSRSGWAGKNTSLEWINQEIQNQEKVTGGNLLDVYQPNSRYFQQVTGYGGNDSDYRDEYVSTLARMIQLPPLKRPTASQLLDDFTSFVEEGCEKITISYAAFGNIDYNDVFTPEQRTTAIIWMERQINAFAEQVGESNTDSVVLEAIDLFDRVSMVTPVDKEFSVDSNNKLNAAVSVYIALALMTNWGADFLELSEKEEIPPLIFSNRITAAIMGLKTKLFRPTLDTYSGMSPRAALDFLRKNLSISKVETVSASMIGLNRGQENLESRSAQKTKQGWFGGWLGF